MKAEKARIAEIKVFPDFLHGKEYVHASGEIVRFDDQSWCLSPVVGKRQTISFGDLPHWLIRPAKLTVAHGWLALGNSLSWCVASMSCFRRIAHWLKEFDGVSMADLTTEHTMMLELKLASEVSRYNDAHEEEATKLGRTLSYRESEKIRNELGLYGPVGVSTLVARFNLAARLSEEIDDLCVTARLRTPRMLNVFRRNKGIGSADPNKILSPQQIATLERALSGDLRRYDRARALLERELSRLDLTRLAKGPALDLQRYLGINGYREHKATEVAELRGIKPRSGSEVPRRLRRFLSKKIGPELATKVIALRGLISRKKRFSTRRAEVEEARNCIRDILSGLDLTVVNPKALCIQWYFGLSGFRVHSLAAVTRQIGLKSKTSGRMYIRRSLISLVGITKAKRLLAVRQQLRR